MSTRGPKTKLTKSDQTDQLTLPPPTVKHVLERSGIWVDLPHPYFFQNSRVFFWQSLKQIIVMH